MQMATQMDMRMLMPLPLNRHPRGALVGDPVYKRQWIFDQRLRCMDSLPLRE